MHKKTYFNHALKFAVVSGLTLFLTSCEKEVVAEKEQIVEEVQDKLIKIEDVSINEIPQIKSFLNEKPIVAKPTSNKGASSKTDETAFGTVDFSEIKKLTDTLGQVTYTFRMIKPSARTSVDSGYYFDNLVIKLLGDEGGYESYILRYTYGGEYKEVDYEYYGLSGKIEHYPLTETSFGLNFIDPSLTARDSCRLYVESDCGKAGHHSSLDEPGCTSNSLAVTIYVECFGLSDELLVSGNYTSPDDTGGDPSHGGGGRPGSTSPALSPYDAIDMAKYEALDRLLDLRNWEYAWLYELRNHRLAMQIYDFLENDTSDEAVEFVNEAIDALMEDEDLEFEVLVRLINGMDKDCQALILFKSILKVNSTFTNLIKDSYLATNKPNISFVDIAVGEGDPPLLSGEGARTQPHLGTDASTGEPTVIIEFNNDYLDQATDLGFVNTLYHELLHAHILNLYHKDQLLTVYPVYTSLNTAMNNYYSDDTNLIFGEAYEQEMHNIYVDFIDVLAESLVEYATAYNISGIDMNYAKKLVWGGLKGNDVFTDSLTSTEQNEAQTLLAKENFNHSDAKSSKTCN
ncbi:hypothetical protein [Flavivirga algicola]|uniref:Uncharacterized protein n=1 Tax=Flavivirga algicola TaxID=2729136 RepID=A0ABX1RYQ5_9FLAO|nr:hypothetical protein [Flavivirga algicola]NMH87624.1 hypothetical protein [Flavivirga algicola]